MILDWRNVQVASTNEFDSWLTLEDMFYPLPSGNILKIAAGYETDLASIPRILWNIWPPFAPQYRNAAIIHDGLYSSELLPRNQCDWLLLLAMREMGNDWFTRNSFYFAVRTAGGVVWSEHTPASIAAARQLVGIMPDPATPGNGATP